MWDGKTFKTPLRYRNSSYLSGVRWALTGKGQEESQNTES